MSGYKLIKPLLYADMECEAPTLDNLKRSVGDLIESEKAAGKITSASFYLRVFSGGKWTSYNADERYHPASMSKVPVLITFMKMAEAKPGLLDEKYSFSKRDTSVPSQYYNSQSIQVGRPYTVRELLRYMIAYSDNEATTLLWEHINLDQYKKTFTDIGLASPSFEFDAQKLSVKQYATFFKVLYNGSYLSSKNSEFCLSLLSQADFKNGLLKKLPPNTMVAHKFGECTYPVAHAAGEKPYGKLNELHESGVVYTGDATYLITVMSKGENIDQLSELVGNISSVVYNSLTKPNNAQPVSKN